MNGSGRRATTGGCPYTDPVLHEAKLLILGEGGDFVNVTLHANVTSSSAYQVVWDTNNDGRVDARGQTVTVAFPDEVLRTVRAGAQNQEGQRAVDSLTFATIRVDDGVSHLVRRKGN